MGTYRFTITYLAEDTEDGFMSSLIEDVRASSYNEAYSLLIARLDLCLICESYAVTDYTFIED